MFKLIKQSKSVLNRPVNFYKNNAVFGKKILIIGGFHGDEPQGAEILTKYVETEIDAKNQICIVPCLNPDGIAAKTRTNANGVDLNRNFATENWALTEQDEFFGGSSPQSEPETQFICEIISDIFPDLILTIHAPFKVVNYDGPAYDIAFELAKIFNYPVQNDIGYPTPGSFGTYCGIERNIPTITLELGEDEDFSVLEKNCIKTFAFLSAF